MVVRIEVCEVQTAKARRLEVTTLWKAENPRLNNNANNNPSFLKSTSQTPHPPLPCRV